VIILDLKLGMGSVGQPRNGKMLTALTVRPLVSQAAFCFLEDISLP